MIRILIVNIIAILTTPAWGITALIVINIIWHLPKPVPTRYYAMKSLRLQKISKRKEKQHG